MYGTVFSLVEMLIIREPPSLMIRGGSWHIWLMSKASWASKVAKSNAFLITSSSQKGEARPFL